ncbi:uncharacterized protein MONBRDRAFT_4686 [Monosiga brevicollis MX1]|uniref:Uncharacterized protein n=1 Tax=Monosiga brevicollis TaxID=81824 RepID=A9UNM3_MONBE|nr:uncharacterized protein MONBRDRAFT_4686 [Monosiga brevicollis MX1]EDQ92725.1 predicted protein [Monosiga brevicollis MX1]|eukprot:XP_001742487.1 hypothetical protein [Monosiga brevicollis MX1]
MSQHDGSQSTATPEERLDLSEQDRLKICRACMDEDLDQVVELLSSWTPDRTVAALAPRKPELGQTPLFVACYNWDNGIVPILLDYGGDVNLPNNIVAAILQNSTRPHAYKVDIDSGTKKVLAAVMRDCPPLSLPASHAEADPNLLLAQQAKVWYQSLAVLFSVGWHAAPQSFQLSDMNDLWARKQAVRIRPWSYVNDLQRRLNYM